MYKPTKKLLQAYLRDLKDRKSIIENQYKPEDYPNSYINICNEISKIEYELLTVGN